MTLLCGIDEAGRGPLAGPVCSAAVILPQDFDISFLNDSKKLTEKKREAARLEIYQRALFWHISWASHDEIDEINILQATLLSMKRAFDGVYEQIIQSERYDSPTIEIIVDGLQKPPITHPVVCQAKSKADTQYPSVMAASILAKTARDRMMQRYGWLYPEYGYEQHKGYGTALHLAAIKKYGSSPIQRQSFKVK